MTSPARTPFHGPPLLERLTDQLAHQGFKDPRQAALDILQSRGQAKADGTLTPAGAKRDALGAEGRALDRAATRTGRPASDFKYNKATNAATLKKKTWGS